MAEPKSFASLSSSLLARKGAAKPAMRPQGWGQGVNLEDLGWNDMGGPSPAPERPEHVPSPIGALTPSPRLQPVEAVRMAAPAAIPSPVIEQQQVIEEIVKPFTLALRLFGNIFAGGIMLSLIGLMPLYILWGPEIIWKAFGIFIGLIQAFIFALLTILYFAEAGEVHDDEEHTGSDSSSGATSSGATSTGDRTGGREDQTSVSDTPQPAGATAR